MLLYGFRKYMDKVKAINNYFIYTYTMIRFISVNMAYGY